MRFRPRRLLLVGLVALIVAAASGCVIQPDPSRGYFPCGYNAEQAGAGGDLGYAPMGGIGAMRPWMTVRIVGGAAWRTRVAVDRAVDKINAAAGTHWVRGDDLPWPGGATGSTLTAPSGEVWVFEAKPERGPGAQWTRPKSARLDKFAPAWVDSAVMSLSSSLPDSIADNAVLHEMGHAAGLDHYFALFDLKCQVMSYGTQSPSLELGDKLGLSKLADTARGLYQPFGWLDSVTSAAPGEAVAAGWAIDRDDPTAPVQIHFYADGLWAGATTASGSRPDVGQAVGGSVGANHGFTHPMALAPGRHEVCAYAIQIGWGDNPLLACSSVVVS